MEEGFDYNELMLDGPLIVGGFAAVGIGHKIDKQKQATVAQTEAIENAASAA